MTNKKTNTNQFVSSTMAKSDDGNIQITFNIALSLINDTRKKVIESLAHESQVPGFRKGKAPIEQAQKHISEEEVVNKTLQNLLPKAFSDAINEYKIVPAIYPKFELIKAGENEAWEIRASTCELPKFELGDYKKNITTASKVEAIWTPGKDKDEKAKEKSHEEKEQAVIKVLLESIKIDIPKLLVDEEVNSRLTSLLERTERLGLKLESYLTSVGKTPESLRSEYEIQAKNTIALDLILEKIASEEKENVTEAQIDEVIKASSADTKLSEKLNTPEQRRFIASILRRRAVLEKLTSLI
jgi:FKBP-type peptidyl-prolyl cis-trans isomerase (trigger factor)